ncbi:crosslink repair DNA glycosylase YcaQ family protein [Leifsonia sp. H3M29-4]|uniref:winged helix-turn-helix domain-containing protein n=1 Tax=Salinibacterium metalliresistens TaxID=3031321 RepID=UPI0023DA5BC5|nr:crosslink repair DNA glycosylase YcaQ family protein [Salinibacterium metalliresistens]MDF1479454.1 crosslink repair DNA glycosylase YcaQ family protein [Salinibacterium metalliresistens]
MVESISAEQARRIALAAQGFGRPPATVGTRQLNLALKRLAVLQLDSVNVFERSHYLPLYARLGPYDKTLLDRLTFSPRSGYTEYWAHQAAVIPLEHRPLWHWAMEKWRGDKHFLPWATENPQMLDFLRAELREKGPLTAGQVEHDANRRKGPWWGWSDVKTGLETLFFWGEVVVAGRTRFERRYDLAERHVSPELLGREVSKNDAVRELVRLGSRALGVGTVGDIADYYRLLQAPTKAAIRDLVDAGELLPVTVRGWDAPAYLHRDARIPRRVEAAALLSPFDPIVWERDRALRMFGFHYRIEIYTPAPQRKYGYYTMPLLIDEALVGRIDLKSDRQAGVLRVQSAWREPGASVDLDRVTALLRQTAAWQGLERIEVAEWGDLAAGLRAALG